MPTWILVADNSRARIFAADPASIRRMLPDHL
jgi:hypothetical protein